MDFSHAAVPDQTARLRRPGSTCGRPDRLHAGPEETSAGVHLAISHWTDIHAAIGGQRPGRKEGNDLGAPRWRRRQLAVRRIGPGDGFCLRWIDHEPWS